MAPAPLDGRMAFAALVTPDLIAAERFYGSMFGWQFSNAYAGRTLIGQATQSGHMLAAIVQKAPDAADITKHPAWRTFLDTGNVVRSTDQATQSGATLLVPPHDIRGVGTLALLADPQGAVFGLWRPASAEPADGMATDGTWIWTALVTTDPQMDASFYRGLLGYDVDVPEPAVPQHLILASQGFARAGINPLSAGQTVSHPRWIDYVRVDDVAASSARATALGGRVVVAPHQDQDGGTLALLADPAGALFGVLSWPDATAEGAAK